MADRKMKKYRLNIFTALIIIASFSFASRAVNVLTFKGASPDQIGVSLAASAPDKKLTEAEGEEPPPMTKGDTAAKDDSITKAEVEKAVKATAGEIAASEGEIQEGDGAKKASTETAPPPVYDEQRSFSDAEIEVLQSLSKRRTEIEARDQKLNEREALLKAAEQAVDKKIAELAKMKGEIEALLGQQEDMEDSRITSLVKIYEAMKPKEAAIIFNTLDMDVLLSVVSRMNERKLSPILASMDPDKARLVTIKLAEQRKLPEKAEKPAKPPVIAPEAAPETPLNLPENTPVTAP